MKTVTGRVVTTHPISLSKAASYLSKFVSSENGASQAISSYLRHASAAFKELKSLHKELKSLSFKDRIPSSAVMLEQDLTPVPVESGQPDKLSLGKRQEERENRKVGHLMDNGTEIVSRVSGTVKEEKPNHDWRWVSQGLSQEEDSEKKEGKQKKDKKMKKKNKEENKNGDDRKLTRELEAVDTSMKGETGEHREEERNKKKKKRKNSGETDFEEKKKKKEAENENGEDKKKKKNKEENLNGDDGKIAGELKAGDKSMKVEAEEHRDEERNEKKKKRKNSGETDSEEKKSKKKRRSKGD